MTAQIKPSDINSTPLPCTVCGREPGIGIGWFLLVENTWFDTIRIFHWHPALAEVPEMRAACSRQHLRILLAHWLAYANLQFTAGDAHRKPLSTYVGMADHGQGGNFPTALVGELAVYRETLSREWNGAAQTLEAIFKALLSGVIEGGQLENPVEVEIDTPLFNFPDTSVGISQTYALHN